MAPVGRSNFEASYHFLNELTFFLPTSYMLPSFFKFCPKNPPIAIGNLKSLGIGPDWMILISLESNPPTYPQTSEIIRKSGRNFHKCRESLIKKGFG